MSHRGKHTFDAHDAMFAALGAGLCVLGGMAIVVGIVLFVEKIAEIVR